MKHLLSGMIGIVMLLCIPLITHAQNCLIPRDNTWTAVAINDDGSTAAIPLGFTFNLYGTPYTSVYINTNGNLTFTAPEPSFSSTGFPFTTPMVAPFWSDVDTRPQCGGGGGGIIYYKLYPTRLEVLWQGVGYYDQHCTLLNTFEVVIGTTNDPVIGLGQNVLFNYGDMQWTTGDASLGTSGFGGIPATVGINKGDNVNYVQVGRFSQNNSNYDGGLGNEDGVNYLDNKCFAFNVSNDGNIPPSFSGLPTNNTINIACGQTANYIIQAIGPEVNQTVSTVVNSAGLCGVTSPVVNGVVSTTNLTIQGSPCNVGSHVITLTATDNGSPAGVTTVTITVNVTGEPTPTITPGGPTTFCPGGSVVLTSSSGAFYQWQDNGSNITGATGASYTATATGNYRVIVTGNGGCSATSAPTAVTVEDHLAPVASVSPLPTITAECSATVSAPTATDNCAGIVTGTTTDPTSYQAEGTYTIHWTYNDGNGNTSSQNQTVIIHDVTPPTIPNMPSSVSVNNDPGMCGAMVSYTEPTSADNCSTCAPASIPGYTLLGTFNGHTYFKSVTGGTWQSFNSFAPTIGAHMATISSNAEDTFLSAHASGQAWIGFTDQAVEGTFKWSNGEPVVYTHWCSGEPNNLGGEDYTTINWGTGGCWNDLASTTTSNLLPGIIEFDCGRPVRTGLASGSFFPKGTTTISYTATDGGGNITTNSFTITVNDVENPTITNLPASTSVNNDPGVCGAHVSWVAPGSSDNCPGSTIAQTAGPVSGSVFPVGTTTITYTATDASNNMHAESFTVTVNDNEAPVASCQSYILNLVNGSGTVSPANIDNGSHDNCGTITMTVTPNTFTCADAGVHTVDLAVTDGHNNTSHCTTTVTVQYQPTCSIVAVPSNTTYTGGVPNNIYLGYGPQSATLTPTVTGGSGFTYSWSPATYLSNASLQNPVFTPTAPGTYTYTLTVTNTNGCSSACQITMCVLDIRVSGNGNNGKVYICHVPPGNVNNANTLSISVNAVPSHLGAHPGDHLGMCTQVPCASNRGSGPDYIAPDQVKVYPNPNTGSFVVEVPYVESKAQITVTDVEGKVISRKTITDADGNKIMFDMTSAARGMYFVEVQYGDQRFRTKLTIQ